MAAKNPRKPRKPRDRGALGKGKGLKRNVQPDAALADIVGNKPMSRLTITSRIWDYIREAKLSDPADGRKIRVSGKLSALTSLTVVKITDIPRIINEHIIG
jgi:chromatin remodeling complex protein RSC6